MTGLRAAVFGASGGIGAALVERLEQSGRYKSIYAGARAVTDPHNLGNLRFTFDLMDEATIAQAAVTIGAAGPLDLAIIATGLLHRPGELAPEKSWRSIDGAAMTEMFAINATGPALIAKHILPLLHRDRRTVFVALSARVGSISDNRLGGWHSYRASKAALNMLIRTFAIEYATRNPDGIVVAAHPGTVDTPLSSPFQRGVPKESLLSPKKSASHIVAMIDGLTPADTGGLFAWDGARISY